MPELQAIWEDYRADGLEIIAVNLAEPLSLVLPYARQYDFLFLLDADQSTWSLYRQGGYIPLNYVLDNDPEQTVVGWMEGFNDQQVRGWIDQVVTDRPKLALQAFSLIDTLGNGDGWADPGETVELVVSVRNQPGYTDADSVSLKIRTDDPGLVLLDSLATIDQIPAGSTRNHEDDPFSLEVLSSPLHFADLELLISAQPGDYAAAETLRIVVGRPSLLLVDDDEGADYERYYFSALDDLGVVYDHYDASKLDSSPRLHSYEAVIWFTGDDRTTTLIQSDIDSLESYLDDGGNLFITGQNIGYDIGNEAFFYNYLHSLYVADEQQEENWVMGVSGDPVGDGLSFVIQGGDGAGNQDSRDVVSPVPGADSCFYYWFVGGDCGIRYEGIYRVVYLSFGFEGISASGDRRDVMDRILTWFGLEGTAVEEMTEVAAAEPPYITVSPNPFNSATQIRYSVPSRSAVKVDVYDSTGRLVRGLVDDCQGQGTHEVQWDGKDSWDREMPSGVYFIRIHTPREAAARKIVRIE